MRSSCRQRGQGGGYAVVSQKIQLFKYFGLCSHLLTRLTSPGKGDLLREEEEGGGTQRMCAAVPQLLGMGPCPLHHC